MISCQRLVLLALLLPVSAFAVAQSVRFDIGAQPLPTALEVFANQAKVQLLYKHDAVKGATSNAVVGDFEPRDALSILLNGTGLEVIYSKDDAVTIRPAQSRAKPTAKAPPANPDVRLAQAEAPTASGQGRNVEPAVADEAWQLEEVIVSARKRVESVQKVPASVAVVSGADLLESNIVGPEELQSKVPGINVSLSAARRESLVSIRGVGTQSFSAALDPSVGFALDGVVTASPDQALVGFFDVDRVEVLRGPQGTLFGKNSSAGLISIVTRDPVLEHEGDLQIGTGSYDLVRATGALNIPVTDAAAMRLAFLYSDRDGFVENTYDGRKFEADRQAGVRLKGLFQPSEDRRIVLTLEYVDQSDTLGAGTAALLSLPARDPRGLGESFLSSIVGAENDLANTDGVYAGAAKNEAASLQWEESVGSHTLSSITAWRRQDGDYANYGLVPQDPVSVATIQTDTSQFSQELRLASPADGRYDYVVGLYYYEHDREVFTNQIADLCGFSAAVPVRNLILARNLNDQDTTASSYAAFGQLNYRFTDRWTGFAGARYTYETVDMTAVQGPWGTYASALSPTTPYRQLLGPEGAVVGSIDTKRPSWQVGARFEPTRNAMLYALVSEGFKGAGFNSVPTTGELEAVAAEIAENYEIGAKLRWADGRVRTNITFFRTDFKDFQAQVNTPREDEGVLVNKLVNAGALRTEGVELELEALAWRGFAVTLNGAYVDARFTEFPNGPCYTALSTAGLCPLGYTDLSGGVLPNSPELSFNAGVTQDIALASMPFDLLLSADYAWRDQIQWSTSQDPEAISPSYGLLNLSTGLIGRNGHWGMQVYVDNVTDAFYSRLSTWTFYGARIRHQLSPDYRRTWGVNVNFSF